MHDERSANVLKRWRDGQDTAMIAVGLFMREFEVVRILHWWQDARHKASCEIARE